MEGSEATVPPVPAGLGRYEVRRRLGSGAFAVVYEGLDPALDAPVAIKVLGDHHSGDPGLRQRFIREARLLRAARSGRLVTVYDIGETDGRPFFVMDYVAGGTLADRLRRHAPLSDEQAIRLIDELADCLLELERAGVVHRDLKPSNLLVRSPGGTDGGFLGRDESLVVGDFGLARSAEASSLTVAAGTDGYMAPEQRMPSVDIGPPADQYAATALVASALSGVAPQEALGQLGRSRRRLAAVLHRGMAERPEDRFATTAHWATAVRSALAPEPGASPPARGRKPVVAAIVAALLAAAVVALAAAVALGLGADGPDIVGPRQIVPGQAVTYTIDDPSLGTHYWTDWEGGVHEAPALRVTAQGPGRLPITVTQVIDGEPRSTTVNLDVVDGSP